MLCGANVSALYILKMLKYCYFLTASDDVCDVLGCDLIIQGELNNRSQLLGFIWLVKDYFVDCVNIPCEGKCRALSIVSNVL